MNGPPPSARTPLRGIAKLFNHLPSGVRAKLETAFVEAENMLDFHNKSVPGGDSRRKLSGLVTAPVITTTSSPTGIAVEWERLDDPRITMYEIEVSSDSVFSAPDKFTTMNTRFSLDGVTTTVFVRVRGVRSDGSAGPFSNSESATPVQASVLTQTDTVSGGTITAPNLNLVTMHTFDYTPGSTGGAVVFGSWAMKYLAAIADTGALDQIRVRVNGRIIADYGARLDTSLSLSEKASYMPSISTVVSANTSKGYCSGFGPGYVVYPAITALLELYNPVVATDIGGGSGTGSPTGWTNPSRATGLPFGAISSGNSAEFRVVYGAGGGSYNSNIIELTDFSLFNMPSDYVITGIALRMISSDNKAADPVNFSQVIGMSLIDPDTGTRSFNYASTPVAWTQVGGTIFGSSTDLWTEAAGYWTPAKLNAAGFGVSIQGKLRATGAFNVSILLESLELTIYATKPDGVRVELQVSPGTSSDDREVIHSTINVMEFLS